ncbi:MAG: type II secretion system protein [Minisyncoccia bacterium]
MNILNITKNRGFTVVETLVAVGILSLSILATFSAVQSGLQYSGLTKEEITAFYLIQESIEYVKNIRDENALLTLNGTSRNWLYGITDSAGEACYFGKTCQLDMNSGTKLSTCSGTCSVLKVNTTSGAYGYSGTWANTSFVRSITFTQISANEVRMNVTLSWTNRGQAKQIQVSELLLNR